jgi:hypothetical protein
MKRTTLITAGLVTVALAAAGCGSSSSTSTPNSTPTPVNTPVEQTAQEAGSGYFDMPTLDAAITSGKMTKADGTPEPAELTPTAAQCVLSGSTALAAQCSYTLKDGTDGVITVSINQDGQSFLITGSN